MKSLFLFVMAMLLGMPVFSAEHNPLIGRWIARDPTGSGETMTFTFTASHMQMADEKPLPYRVERKADTVTVFVQGARDARPAVFTLISENEISMQFPGGPGITLTREEPSKADRQAAAPDDRSKSGALLDEITTAMLPNGVPTRFEPLGQSLEQLLVAGWKLEQISAAQGGFGVWLTKSGVNALCILVPKPFDQQGSALSDCRRLN